MFDLPKISVGDYADSVNRLYALAKKDCGGSRAAQQVLLSAYNGTRYQVDITDLRVLDESFFKDAITVIISRRGLRIEPQNVIADGADRFKELIMMWQDWWENIRGESHEKNKTYFVNRKLEESDYSEVFLVRASVDGNEPCGNLVVVDKDALTYTTITNWCFLVTMETDKGSDVFWLPMLPPDEMLQHEILIGGIKQCKILSEIERYKEHVIDMNTNLAII